MSFGFVDNNSNKGNKLDNQDMAISISHIKNNKIKLLAVADGVGGSTDGSFASKYVIDRIEEWFKNLDISNFYNPLHLSLKLNEFIYKLNFDLSFAYSKYNFGVGTTGTTLTMAVVLMNETVIANIGDSRAYISKDCNLSQVTEDDSLVWKLYKVGKLTKEELKTRTDNNYITNFLGMSNFDFQGVDIKIIDNDCYDTMLLFTDGVTDLVSDEKIQFINNNTEKEKIVNKILDEAVNKQQYGPGGEKLIIGKDNASAVIYKK